MSSRGNFSPNGLGVKYPSEPLGTGACRLCMWQHLELHKTPLNESGTMTSNARLKSFCSCRATPHTLCQYLSILRFFSCKNWCISPWVVPTEARRGWLPLIPTSHCGSELLNPKVFVFHAGWRQRGGSSSAEGAKHSDMISEVGQVHFVSAIQPENGLVPYAFAKCVCATPAVASRVRFKNLPRVSFPLGMNIHAWHGWWGPDRSMWIGTTERVRVWKDDLPV